MEQDRFVVFRSHYLFESSFTSPGEWLGRWDTGDRNAAASISVAMNCRPRDLEHDVRAARRSFALALGGPEGAGQTPQAPPAPVGEQARQAERPNEVWAIDFQFDATFDGWMLKLANVVDEFTREALSTRTGRTCTADALVDVLDRLVAGRGALERVTMRQRAGAYRVGAAGLVRTPWLHDELHRAGLPRENPYVESFNARIRDELLAVTEFCALAEAQVLIEDWRIESTPNGRTPRSATSRR